jgi:hypothetical protein
VVGNVDLWSLITVVANNSQKVDDLLSIAEHLPTEQKAELVQRLLKSSDLNVTFGNNQLSGTIIVQINTMDQAALGDILQAIASRIVSEPPTSNGLPDDQKSPPES